MGSVRVGYESVRDLEFLLKSPVRCRFSLFGGFGSLALEGEGGIVGFRFFGFWFSFVLFLITVHWMRGIWKGVGR